MNEENLLGAPDSAEGGGACPAGPNPLNLPLILRHVFINLPPLDLLNCCEVNKQWNYEARCVLRDFKTCVASNKGDPPCHALRDLNAALSRMAIQPYNGLRLRFGGHDLPCTEKINQEEFNFLRNQFKLKVLRIDWEQFWGPFDWASSCPAVQFLISILCGKHVAETLEELDYVKIEPLRLDFFTPAARIYPKLKTVGFESSFVSNSHADVVYLLGVFFNTAPNLETFDLEWSGNLLPIAAHHQKYQLVQNFRLDPFFWEDQTREFALLQPTLERLSASVPTGDMTASLLTSLKMLLQSSAKTLKHLKLDMILLSTLRSIYSQPLEKLETLQIALSSYYFSDQALMDEIRRINFTWLCPKLNCVTVYPGVGAERRIPLILLVPPPPASVDLEDDAGGDSSRITQLIIEDIALVTSGAVTKLMEIFPHVTSLSVVCHPEFNLDAEFCGIFPVEAIFLQDQDDEFLKNYHLVPVSPSLSQMTSLEQLNFTLRPRPRGTCSSETSPPSARIFFLSSVTGHLVLSRMKHITVTVTFDSPLGPRVNCPLAQVVA